MTERKYSDEEVQTALMFHPQLVRDTFDIVVEKFFELRGEDFLPTHLADVPDGIAWFLEVRNGIDDFVESNQELLLEVTYPVVESFIDELRRKANAPKLHLPG